MTTIGVVDLGSGNTFSIVSALEYLGADAIVCRSGREIEDVDRVVLPGVGSFAHGASVLRRQGFELSLNHLRRSGVPILGVCLGMQLMASSSPEGGLTQGLDWFAAPVLPLNHTTHGVRLPHMGWNSLEIVGAHELLEGVANGDDVYFVHSYCVDEVGSNTLAVTNHGGIIAAAIAQGNVFATQFHPEKSQSVGMRILENFMQWQPTHA